MRVRSQAPPVVYLARFYLSMMNLTYLFYRPPIAPY